MKVRRFECDGAGDISLLDDIGARLATGDDGSNM